MPRRESNATELADSVLAILEEQELLKQPASDLEQARDRIAEFLVRKGFFRKDVHTIPTTIMLSDIRGFSSIANSYPAGDVVAMLNRYFAAMGEIITRYGGRIDKLMGDSILVVFGLPESSEGDVANAIACAVEMQQSMSEVNSGNQKLGLPDLYMGIGLNSGEVVVGELGSDHYNEYTVIGDEVNLVSRIESHSLRGQILISEKTYGLAREFIEVSEPKQIEVKGGRMALNLYEVYSTKRPRLMKVPRREVRKSPRVATSMPLAFQMLSGKIVQPDKYYGRVLDISYHGMMVESEIRLPVLSEIKMSLALELFGSKTSEVYARILTCESSGDLSRSSMEFTSISDEGQAAIKQFVDQLITSP